ncbi:MAG: hypothetical protein K2K88_06945 [Muribaculaceae bacterium]|nr:hypothetical protein [Muribaculaceae bacterium]
MIKKFFKCVAIVIGMVALQSCDKGPDYGKMSPSMMDIAGAKSIGFINETAASRGEALSSGLYKIDANGNISAVAVYFTEDEDGNQTQHQDEVKMHHAYIYNVGTDYLFFKYCMFVDKKGEFIEHLPSYILVRKSDGKMWSCDNIFDNISVIHDGQFYQADDATLYCGNIGREDYSTYYYNEIYKLNLKNEPVTVEQVTANVEIGGPFVVDSKGVICGPVNSPNSYWGSGTFAWQNSGFQNVNWGDSSIPYIRDYSDIVEGLEVEDINTDPCIVYFRGQFYTVCGLKPELRLNGRSAELSDYPFVELGICNKISIGDTPGSAKIDDSETINIKNDIGSDKGYELESVMTTDEYILTSGYTEDYKKPWITALNPETKSWKWVTETPDLIKFDKTVNYNNRYWVVTTIDENLGAWWINIKTLETGFVKFNDEIPSYMKSEYDYADGSIIYSGINPADSHEVKIAFDLMTGNAVTNDNAPVYKFSTLVSLN